MADLRSTTRSFYESMSSGADLDAMMERFVADDFVEHEAMPPGIEGSGRDAARQVFEMMLSAFPDFRVEIHDLIEEGDKVAARVEFIGTHQGTFMGVPPSGNQMRIQVMDILQFRDDVVIAHWGLMDTASLMAQLGAGEGP